MTAGHCHCGATRYRFDEAAVLWRGICHCGDCTRAAGAPMVGWFGVRDGGWQWQGQTPGAYASSAPATRWFCTTCGTPLAFRSDRWPEEIHFTAATLDDPASFQPRAHFYTHAELPWARVTDDLRRFARTATD